MSYLLYIAGFGLFATVLLWLRDARILYRTGLSGYRTAAYHGVACTALATLAVAVAAYLDEIVGLGLVLLALFLQGRGEREKVFSGREPPLDRLLGKSPQRKDKG